MEGERAWPPIPSAATLDCHRSENPTVNCAHEGSRVHVPYKNLIPDDLRWKSFILNPAPNHPPGSVEKLPSTKPVPGAKREWGLLPSSALVNGPALALLGCWAAGLPGGHRSWSPATPVGQHHLYLLTGATVSVLFLFLLFPFHRLFSCFYGLEKVSFFLSPLFLVLCTDVFISTFPQW